MDQVLAIKDDIRITGGGILRTFELEVNLQCFPEGDVVGRKAITTRLAYKGMTFEELVAAYFADMSLLVNILVQECNWSEAITWGNIFLPVRTAGLNTIVSALAEDRTYAVLSYRIGI